MTNPQTTTTTTPPQPATPPHPDDLPHPLTIYLSTKERRDVLRRLRNHSTDRRLALLRALNLHPDDRATSSKHRSPSPRRTTTPQTAPSSKGGDR